MGDGKLPEGNVAVLVNAPARSDRAALTADASTTPEPPTGPIQISVSAFFFFATVLAFNGR